MNMLKKLQKDFPQVKKIVDARRSIVVSVTKHDSSAGRKKDHQHCALARACVRQKLADAAVIGIGTSYLIRGDRAIRFMTSQSVAREITSFDRHQDFAEGTDYRLSKVSPSGRRGTKRESTGNGKKHPHTGPAHRHYTSNVRITNRLPKAA